MDHMSMLLVSIWFWYPQIISYWWYHIPSYITAGNCKESIITRRVPYLQFSPLLITDGCCISKCSRCGRGCNECCYGNWGCCNACGYCICIPAAIYGFLATVFCWWEVVKNDFSQTDKRQRWKGILLEIADEEDSMHDAIYL